jgi:hypothetical protein
MSFVARQLTPTETRQVLDEPDLARPLLFDESGEAAAAGRRIDLDKAWHGIHYLLTGTVWEKTTTPIGQALLGGQELAGHSDVRLLDAAHVRQTADALALLDQVALRRRYVPARLAELDIYPNVWEVDDSALDEYLLPNLATLVEFYRTAAATNAAVLMRID